MKYRHWQRIQTITGHTFDLERAGFALKDIMEAPLLQNKEDIEDVCISALKEKDIEAKLRQVTSEWSLQELSFQVGPTKIGVCKKNQIFCWKYFMEQHFY